MLYLTTRDPFDAYTPVWTLESDQAPNGGRFVPYQHSKMKPEKMRVLSELSFGAIIAQTLCDLFYTDINGWNVEFCIGRYPVQLVNMGRNVLVAQCWQNLDGSYAMLEKGLVALLCQCAKQTVEVTSWARISVRIAVLKGIFGQLLRQGITEPVDVAVPDGDFTLFMAVWYCRQMGLPIGNIICGCRPGSPVWNLLHTGQLRTNGGVMPELERLIFGCLGISEAQRFAACCKAGENYILQPEAQDALRQGIFCAVVSDQRKSEAIPNVYRTSAYILDPQAAVSYSALLDYRARFGESRCALILEDNSPADSATEVATALKMTLGELNQLLQK